MALLDNILSYHRVVDTGGSVFEHVDQAPTPLSNGVKFGSPTQTTGTSGENFLVYNGSSQYSHLPFASSDVSTATRTFAFRAKSAVTPSSLNFLAGLCSTTDNDPYLAADGTGADSCNIRSRDDVAGSGTNVSTGTSSGLWDGTERIFVVTITGGVQSIKELTTGVNASVTSGLSTTTVDRLGLAAFARTSSPVWYCDIDISWVAVWDRALVAQDETDLAAAAWPFVAAGPTITDVNTTETVQVGDTPTVTGTSFLATGGTQSWNGVSVGFSSWADTSITSSAITRGDLAYDTNYDWVVTDNLSVASSPISVQLAIETNYQVVTLSSPIITLVGGYRTSLCYGSVPDCVTGDQLRAPTTTDLGKTLTINVDGTFSITDAGNTEQTFDFEIWDANAASGDKWTASTAAVVNGVIVSGGILSNVLRSPLKDVLRNVLK
jgi:hypothetical protein